MPNRDEVAMNGAAAVLAALLDVPQSKRLDALAMACDAFNKGAILASLKSSAL